DQAERAGNRALLVGEHDRGVAQRIRQLVVVVGARVEAQRIANRIDDRLVGLLAKEMDTEQFERQRRRRGYRQGHNQGETKQSPAVAAGARVIAMRLFPGGSHYSKLTANPEIGI